MDVDFIFWCVAVSYLGAFWGVKILELHVHRGHFGCQDAGHYFLNPIQECLSCEGW
jgi:hypothetical protein